MEKKAYNVSSRARIKNHTCMTGQILRLVADTLATVVIYTHMLFGVRRKEADELCNDTISGFAFIVSPIQLYGSL